MKRNAVFGAAYDHDIHDVSRPNLSVQTRFVVADTWKLLSHRQGTAQGKPVELYNLSVDPAEMQNLAARHPGKVKELSAKLDAWWAGPKRAP
jgi:uncharacterized sulfatase